MEKGKKRFRSPYRNSTTSFYRSCVSEGNMRVVKKWIYSTVRSSNSTRDGNVEE